MKQTSAMVLSAGLGTRMRPLSYECPKPLLPLCGRTLLTWNLQALKKAEITHVGINTFHLAQQVPQAVQHRTEQFYWSHEDTLQGTGGGVRGLHQCMQHQAYVIINGDAFFDFPIRPLLHHHEQQGAIATLAVRRVPADDPFARIGLDAMGRVVRIAEVCGPRAHEEVMAVAFTGVQMIQAEVCQALPDGFCDIFRSAYKSLMLDGVEIHAHLVADDSLWVDVGTPQRYLDAHQVLYQKKKSPLWQDMPAYHRHGDGICFDQAQVSSSIHLQENTWVGSGAKLSGQVNLSHSIIWPDVYYDFNDSIKKQEKSMQNILISAKGLNTIGQ